jgi:hypothetical protein
MAPHRAPDVSLRSGRSSVTGPTSFIIPERTHLGGAKNEGPIIAATLRHIQTIAYVSPYEVDIACDRDVVPHKQVSADGYPAGGYSCLSWVAEAPTIHIEASADVCLNEDDLSIDMRTIPYLQVALHRDVIRAQGPATGRGE